MHLTEENQPRPTEEYPALTAHLVYPTGDHHDALLRSACDALTNRFGIGHATLQVERGSDAHACHLASGNVI